jgi:CheY-like chemotaxis protein
MAHPDHEKLSVVVVVDDEALLRLIAVEFLIEEGYVALEAEHAAGAIALLEARAAEIHLLFSDHRMPVK